MMSEDTMKTILNRLAKENEAAYNGYKKGNTEFAKSGHEHEYWCSRRQISLLCLILEIEEPECMQNELY